jgi:putative membrane protein
MKTLQIILVSIVALEHLYFLILEMFLWTTPKGIKAFGLKTKEFAEETKVLAANQGLYNGFLAAGLIYSLIVNDKNTTIFFLVCVVIAGIYGAYSTKKLKLFYIQSVPAIFSLILTFTYF